jgi:hypothetical protein
MTVFKIQKGTFWYFIKFSPQAPAYAMRNAARYEREIGTKKRCIQCTANGANLCPNMVPNLETQISKTLKVTF